MCWNNQGIVSPIEDNNHAFDLDSNKRSVICNIISISCAIIKRETVLKFQDGNINGKQRVSVGHNCLRNKKSFNAIPPSSDDDSLQNFGENYVFCSQPKNMEFN